METSRGRWFLAEFARRNRNADTEMLLAAIGQLKNASRTECVTPPRANDAAQTTPLVSVSMVSCWRAPARPATACRDELRVEGPALPLSGQGDEDLARLDRLVA